MEIARAPLVRAHRDELAWNPGRQPALMVNLIGSRVAQGSGAIDVDPRRYRAGCRVTDAQMATIDLAPH